MKKLVARASSAAVGAARAAFRSRKLRFFLGFVALVLAWWSIRPYTLPKPPRPDEATYAQAKRVRIVRDAPDSLMVKEVLEPLASLKPETDTEKEALVLLARWDRRARIDSTEAALAILIWRAVNPDVAGGKRPAVDAAVGFRRAIAWLVAAFGKVAVPLGDVQRLRRGSVDLPIGGGPGS